MNYPLHHAIPNTRLTPYGTGKFDKSKGGYRTFLCKCECGSSVEVAISHIRRGIVKSCGCLRKEILEEGHRIFTAEEAISNFYAKIKKERNGCWIWIGAKNDDGYGSLAFLGKTISAHRLAWILAYGNIPNALSVLHKCDVPACVNPVHLFLGTQADNVLDCALKGRIRQGDRSGNKSAISPFIDSQIEFIRQTASEGFSRSCIARYFGVSRSSIDAIVNRKTWKNL